MSENTKKYEVVFTCVDQEVVVSVQASRYANDDELFELAEASGRVHGMERAYINEISGPRKDLYERFYKTT